MQLFAWPKNDDNNGGNGVIAMATFPDPIRPADQPFVPVGDLKIFLIETPLFLA